MAAEARAWSHRADVRRLADEITRTAPPGRCDAQVRDVWRWITTHVPHRRMDEIALIDPAHLRPGAGADCKTLAALAAALLRSLGWRVGFMYGRRGDRWHVWTLAECPRTARVVSLDPTYPQFGMDWRGNEQADELHMLWIDPPQQLAGNLTGAGKLTHMPARPPTQQEWDDRLWTEKFRVHKDDLRDVAWGGIVVTARPFDSDQLYLIRTPADAADIWHDHPHYQATCQLIASTPGAFAIVIPWADPEDPEQWIYFKKGRKKLAWEKWKLQDRNVPLGVYPTPLAWTPDRARVWISSEKWAAEDHVSRHDSAKDCFKGKDRWSDRWENAMRADLIPSKFKGKPINEWPGSKTKISHICHGHWRGGKPGFDLGSALADFFIGASGLIPVVGPALNMAASTAKALVEADARQNQIAHQISTAPGIMAVTPAEIEVAVAQMVFLNVYATAPKPPPIVLGAVTMQDLTGITPAPPPPDPDPVVGNATVITRDQTRSPQLPDAGAQTSITPPATAPASGSLHVSAPASPQPQTATAPILAGIAGIAGWLLTR